MTYRIWGKYRGRVEQIDEFTSRAEAQRMLGEYRLAFGPSWTLWLGKKSEEPR